MPCKSWLCLLCFGVGKRREGKLFVVLTFAGEMQLINSETPSTPMRCCIHTFCCLSYKQTALRGFVFIPKGERGEKTPTSANTIVQPSHFAASSYGFKHFILQKGCVIACWRVAQLSFPSLDRAVSSISVPVLLVQAARKVL